MRENERKMREKWITQVLETDKAKTSEKFYIASCEDVKLGLNEITLRFNLLFHDL